LINDLQQYPEGEPENPEAESKEIYGESETKPAEDGKKEISTVTKTTA